MSEELEELRKMGACRDFVRTKQGRWNHFDWIVFLRELRDAGYRSVPDGEIGLELAEAKAEFWKAYLDLRTTFVYGKEGQWNHADWLEFLANLRADGLRFLTDAEVGLTLERHKSEYWQVKNREAAELQRKRKQVTIRIEGKEESVEETFIVDDALMLDTARLQKFSLPASEDQGVPDISIAIPVGIVGLPWGGSAFGGLFGDVVRHIVDTAKPAAHTIKVFIKTSEGGAVLAIITRQVVEQVCKQLKARLAKRKVLLYGPDGKRIEWE